MIAGAATTEDFMVNVIRQWTTIVTIPTTIIGANASVATGVVIGMMVSRNAAIIAGGLALLPGSVLGASAVPRAALHGPPSLSRRALSRRSAGLLRLLLPAVPLLWIATARGERQRDHHSAPVLRRSRRARGEPYQGNPARRASAGDVLAWVARPLVKGLRKYCIRRDADAYEAGRTPRAPECA